MLSTSRRKLSENTNKSNLSRAMFPVNNYHKNEINKYHKIEMMLNNLNQHFLYNVLNNLNQHFLNNGRWQLAQTTWRWRPRRPQASSRHHHLRTRR